MQQKLLLIFHLLQNMAKLPLIPPTKKQLKRICDDINLTPKQLDKGVTMLREWLRMQPHLPQDALGKFHKVSVNDQSPNGAYIWPTSSK